MTARSSVPRVAPRWVIPVCALGFALIHLACVLAPPPFRGIDEFDHAYRAAAVARGQWVAAPEPAAGGTGATLHVPPDIVRAAAPVCWSLPYTSAEECRASGQLSNGLVTVGSAAGRYNPVFYAAVGAPSLPFSGSTALYAMRFASVVLCSLFFAFAVWSLMRWSRTRIPLLTLLVTTTPMIVYSGAVAAPNGLEMVAALALWCSLLGLALADERGLGSRTRTWLWCVAGISGAALVTLRSLGPLWMVLIVATVLVVAPDRRALLRSLGTRAGAVAGVAVTVATVLSVTWILAMRSLQLREDGAAASLSLTDRVGESLQALPLWVLQSIAAFPSRNEPAPAVVYVTGALLFCAVLVPGFQRMSRRVRHGVLAIVVVSCVIPLTLTMLTIEQYAVAWQGRYGLPLSVGMLLLVGLALDRRPRSAMLTHRFLVLAFALAVIAQAVGPVSVLVAESVTSPLANSTEWWRVPPVVLACLLVLGATLHWWPLKYREVGVEPGGSRMRGLASGDPDAEKREGLSDVDVTRDVAAYP